MEQINIPNDNNNYNNNTAVTSRNPKPDHSLTHVESSEEIGGDKFVLDSAVVVVVTSGAGVGAGTGAPDLQSNSHPSQLENLIEINKMNENL